MVQDEYWDYLYKLAEQDNDRPAVKNSERADFAIKQFELNNIEYRIKNPANGHIHAWDRNGNLHQYWANTGKILGSELRGIHNLIKILKGE